jgi:CRP/FNR family transcriptional regulator, anaerobic regulatory protein
MLTLLDSPVSEFARTASTATEGFRTLAAGEVLFREGDARSHVYRVEKGSICLFKERGDGAQVVLEFAFPGDLVGLGYLDNHVSGAQATMETSLSCLPRSALEPALERNPNTKSRLTAAIEREVAFLKETHERAGRSKPLERIAALFVTLARCNAYEGRDPSVLTDSLSCGVVAGYLNVSVDELAHWLTELESLDLVEAVPNGLLLKNLDELEKLADGAD